MNMCMHLSPQVHKHLAPEHSISEVMPTASGLPGTHPISAHLAKEEIQAQRGQSLI